MLGFAVVDHQAGSGVAAIWLMSRVAANAAEHTNAINLDLLADEDALKNVHALTRDRLVIMTPGSTSEGIPIPSNTLGLQGVDSLASETVEHQLRIIGAVDADACA